MISAALPAAGEGRAAHSGWGRITELLPFEAAPGFLRAVASLVPGLLTVVASGWLYKLVVQVLAL